MNHVKLAEDSLRSEMKSVRIEFSNYLKGFNQELNHLKRDIKVWTEKKSDDITKIESRILSLENQIELFQMLEKEKNPAKSDIFKMLSPLSGLKLLPF
eukprot:gene11217-13742_t